MAGLELPARVFPIQPASRFQTLPNSLGKPKAYVWHFCAFLKKQKTKKPKTKQQQKNSPPICLHNFVGLSEQEVKYFLYKPGPAGSDSCVPQLHARVGHPARSGSFPHSCLQQKVVRRRGQALLLPGLGALLSHVLPTRSLLFSFFLSLGDCSRVLRFMAWLCELRR